MSKVRVLAADADAIAEAARVLAAGGIVAFPTETVYGLGARGLDARAVMRVFEAKGRPATHPLILHVTDEAMARSLARAWPERASRLARAFWPGPLTLVVERAARVPAVVAGGGSSVAVRAPEHPVARALIAAVGEPLAAPSANRYQELSPTTAGHVLKSLGEVVDLVLDGGPCARGIESTVVDVRSEPASVLRPGSLALPALRAIEPEIVSMLTIPPESEERASPGMDRRHYAPRAKLVIVSGRDAALARASELRAPALLLSDDAEAYARDLFARLHAFDDAGAQTVVIEEPPDTPDWWAIRDRLRRMH